MKQLMTDENARQCNRIVSLRFVILRLGRLFFFIFGKLASISQPIRLKTKIWRKLAKHDFARFFLHLLFLKLALMPFLSSLPKGHAL